MFYAMLPCDIERRRPRGLPEDAECFLDLIREGIGDNIQDGTEGYVSWRCKSRHGKWLDSKIHSLNAHLNVPPKVHDVVEAIHSGSIT